MTLIADFGFSEARTGRVWTAPRGFTIDGASIPRALWTIVGSPFTGDYRRASIVHDKACVDFPVDGPQRKAADVMFQAACRAGGCGYWQAQVLYMGVRIGSRWAKQSLVGDDDGIWLDTPPEDERLQAEFREMARELRARSSGLVEGDSETAVEQADEVLARHGFLA